MTPTMRDINKKFSVRYYLNLVLIDEEERRYFKQQVPARDCVFGTGDEISCHCLILCRTILRVHQEITLWRKGDVVRKSMSQQATIGAQRFEGSAASESALEQAAKEESG